MLTILKTEVEFIFMKCWNAYEEFFLQMIFVTLLNK